jgi:hypothetical protein
MNIKGKHLRLARYIKANYAVSIEKAVIDGFELTMINSLLYNKDHSKQVIATNDGKLYLPFQTKVRIK